VTDQARGFHAAVAAMLLIGTTELGLAQEDEEESSKWSNATDFSLVVTEGNSETKTFGFKNSLKWSGEESRFRLKFDAVSSETADDRYLLVDAGLTWLPGEDPPPTTGTTIITPGIEPDVERYFVEGRYDHEISKRLEWHVGGSWDRNEDAGIKNRYIAFSGLGHNWKAEEDLEFRTSYGFSFTDRDEDEPDPEKDDQFIGARLGWDYMNRFGKAALYENDFTANISLQNTSDYLLDMVQSVGVHLTDRLALKVSVQFLYAAEPALEEVDLIGLVELVDPDGTPGNGDEFFQTVSTGGGEFEFGKADIRKDELDTIARTSLVINF
jgi:hypothetical protein